LDELEFSKGKNTLIFVIMDGFPRCIEEAIEAKGLKIYKVDLSKFKNLKENWMLTDENTIYLFHGSWNLEAIKYSNSQRDSLASIERPVVILGKKEEIEKIAGKAPDFWRFRSRTYDLREVPIHEVSIFVKEMIGNEDKIKKKIEENEFLLDLIKDEFHLSELYKNLSILYLMLYEEEKSEEFFGKFLKYLHSMDIPDYLNKGISEIYRIKGDIFLLRGEADKAKDYYLRSLDLVKDNIDALTNLGVAYDRLGKYEEAKKQFDRIIELFPNPYTYYNRGLINFKIGKCREAIRDFEEAISIDPRQEISETLSLLKSKLLELEIEEAVEQIKQEEAVEQIKQEEAVEQIKQEEAVEPKAELKGKAINPEIFRILDLSEIYAFLRNKSYLEAKHKLEDSSLRTYCVFGFHDILIKHYEDRGELDIDYLKIRLPLSDDEILNFGAMRVGETIKFRGIAIYEEDKGSLKIKNDYRVDLPPYNIGEIRKKIADLLSKKKIEKHLIDELREMKILINVEEGLEYSDIKKEEKEKGSCEALVFLKVSLPPAVIADRIEYFNKNGLNLLMEINEIRTIERIISNSGDYSDYDYILHIVVKNLEQLRQIVVEKIHETLTKKEMEVSTKTIFPAKIMSEGKYDALFETPVHGYGRQSALLEILRLLKSEFDEPFLIKKLDEEDIDEIVKFYESIKRRGYQKEPIALFIYGLASALLKIEKESVEEDLFQNCIHLFLGIIADFESCISENWDKWLDRVSEVGEENLKLLINTLYKKNKRELEVKELKRMPIGQRVQIIQMWNSNFFSNEGFNKLRNFAKKLGSGEKEKILNSIGKLERLKPEERTIMFDRKDLLKEFQRNNGPEIRNWFAHFGTYIGDFKLKSKDDVRKILKVAKICLDFLD